MATKENTEEADDIELFEYNYLPYEIEINGKKIFDYTEVEHDKIFLANKKDILTKPRPQWIPEFDEEGLAADDFLPVCVKDYSDGNFYVQSKVKIGEHEKTLNNYARTVIKVPEFENRYYKMTPDVLAATVDYYIKHKRAELKQQGITKKVSVSLPRSLKKMSAIRYYDMAELLSFCACYKDESKNIFKKNLPARSEEYHRQNKIIFKEQWLPLLETVKDKKYDMDQQKQDYANTFKKGEETSYGKSNRSSDLYEDFGIKIKKQNGSTFTREQRIRFGEAVNKVWEHYGSLKELASKNDLTLSYADNCYQFARKSHGIYRFIPGKNEKAIGISFFDENNKSFEPEDVILTHEVAHWLDNEKGSELHHFYASDVEGTLENKIAVKFKQLIRENISKKNNSKSVKSGKSQKLDDYRLRTCECLARAMQEQYALKQGLTIFEQNNNYLPKEQFEKEISPLVKELLEENRKHFNLVNQEQSVSKEKKNIVQVYQVSTKIVYDAVKQKFIKKGFSESSFNVFDNELFKNSERKSWIIPVNEIDKSFSVHNADEYKKLHENDEIQYLNENLELEIPIGTSGLKARSYYNSKNTRKLCHDIKLNDNSEEYKAALEKIADYIVSQGVINENSVLIPAPNHTGKAEYTGSLARIISSKTNASVADVLRCKPHETLYDQKKSGNEPDIELYLENFQSPMAYKWKQEGRTAYLIDNNISTGLTFNKAEKLIPCLVPAVFAIGNFAEIECQGETYHVKNLLKESRTKEEHLNMSDSTVFTKLGFSLVEDKKEIKDIIKICQNVKTEIPDYYKNLNSDDCKFYKIEGNVPLDSEKRKYHRNYETPLYVIEMNSSYSVIQNKTTFEERTYYHEENFPTALSLLLTIGRKTNLSEKESHSIGSWVKTPNANVEVLPEKLFELNILSESDKEFYKNLESENPFNKKLKELILGKEKLEAGRSNTELEKDNLDWLVNTHGCKKEETSEVLHKLYEIFPTGEAFERSKVLPSVFGDLRNTSKPGQLDFDAYEITVEDLDKVLGIYDKNIDYHTVNDRDWAIRHGMSKEDAARLIEWDYSINKNHIFKEPENPGTEIKENKLMEKTNEIKEMTQAEKDSKFLLDTYGNKKLVDAAVKKASINDFISKDQSKYFMTGIYYDKGFAIATDGRMLIKQKKSYPEKWEGKIIDPNTGKEIHGQFPDYNRVFPDREMLVDRSSRLAHISDYLSYATAANAISEATKRSVNYVPVVFDNTVVNPKQLAVALSFAREHGFNKVFQEDNYTHEIVPVLDEGGKEIYKYYKTTEKSEDNLRYKYYSYEELPSEAKEAAEMIDADSTKKSFVVGEDLWFYGPVEEIKIVYENDPEKHLKKPIQFDSPDGSSILIMPLNEPEGPYLDKNGILQNYEENTFIKTKLLGKDEVLHKNIVKRLLENTEYEGFDVDTSYNKNYEEALKKQNPDIFPKNKKDCMILASQWTYADAIESKFVEKNIILSSENAFKEYFSENSIEIFQHYVKNPSLLLSKRSGFDPDYTIEKAIEENIIEQKEISFSEERNAEVSNSNNVKTISFFVKDTAEFEQYADFEPIVNLTAEAAVKKLIELEKKDFSAGIGINIPNDFIFDDPEGNGNIVFQKLNDEYSFYMGDNFVKDLKENNEHSQNVIAAYKELDKAIKKSELGKNTFYVEPAFLYEKEKELFGSKVFSSDIISTKNIKLNNITKDENGFNVADLFIPDADYIKEASISDERFAMPVATWKDNDPNINISIVKRLNSDPHNKDIEYMDYSTNGNPSIFESEKWNLVREQKTFDLIGEQIEQYKQEINTEKTETATEVEITPVTLDDILGVMEMRPEFSDSGKIMIYDEQRKEYIDNGQNFEGSGNEVYEFESAAEIFERLDIYINDYYIHDMQEQLESVGVEITGNESLSDLCKLYKFELEKGNDKLSIGELNLAMGIVEPDTVLYEQRPSVEKNPESTLQPGQNVSLDNFDHKKFFDVYHSSYDEYYNTESKELLKEQSENMWRFDELMKSNPQFKEIVSSLVAERKDPFSSDRECAAVVKAFETMGIDLDVGITQEETKEIRPAFFLYGDTPEDKIVELKEHLSMNGYDIKWKDKKEDNNLTEFTCSIDEKAYVQTILEERGIDYGYELGLLANGFDASWLSEDEQLDAEIVTEEEFKRINALREKEFKDLKLPYIKITYTEGSTENHKSARMESGTVLGLKEGEEILKELNNRFNTFLKCDVTVNFPDAKDNEPGSYSLRYDFQDDKRTLENGKEVPFEREGLSDYIRMTCSYPEVLEKFEQQWQKVNAPNITEEQKKLVADIVEPNYEKLKEAYIQHCKTLKPILEGDKKVHSSWIENKDVSDASKSSLEAEKDAVAVSFERYAGRCINSIADYLDENKDLSFKNEFINYAEHQISNMLQDVKYGDSRKAKYGEHGYDFDFNLWRHSLEKVMDASEYNSFFTERLQIEEKRYKEIRNAAKDMGMTKEETYSLSNEEWRACDELAEEAKMDWWFEEYGSDGEIHKNVSKQDLDDLSTAFDGNLRISKENEFIVRKLLNDKNISFNETYLLSSEEANAKAENLYGFRFEYNEEKKVVDVFNNNTNAWLGITDESGFNYAAEISPVDNAAGRYHIPDEVFKDVTDLASQFFTECRSHSYDFASLADDIIQQAYENSGDGFNYIMDFNTVAGIADKDVQWVKNNITNICDALYKYNDIFLLEFNEEEALAEENEINMYFCSVGEDVNELFKKSEDGRWVRKTDEELRQEDLLEEEIDKGIESIQVNSGMSDAALEEDYDTQMKERELEIDDEPEEPVNAWTINGESFYESEIEESLKADVEELFRQYDSSEIEQNLTLVGVKMYRDPSKDGKISLLVEFDSKSPENRWREDSLFNALNEEGIEFNGMKVDFNPITREKSGTIEQYLKNFAGFENEEEVIKENAQKLEEKETEQKLNDISNKIFDVVSGEKRILPFSIINNIEKGRVNIKFDTTEINQDILKELKAHGWKFAPSTKQWYPVGNAVNTALDFANKLQEKYTEIKTPNVEKPMDLGPEKSPYDGIRFFDRNYNESEEFAHFFNNNLHLFNKGKDSAITEEQASTILKAIGYENVGLVEQRRLRIGLDINDKIVVLSSVNGKVETQKLEFSEVLGFAKEKAAERVVEAKEILEAYVGKNTTTKKGFQDIFISMYETCIEQAESINKRMQDIYDSFMPKEKEVSKEAILYQRNSYRGWEISSDKDFKKSYYVRPFDQMDRSGYILMAGKEGKDGFWQEKFVREMLKSNNWSERTALAETLTMLASDVDVCISLGIKKPQSLKEFLSSIEKIIKVENDTDIKNELMENIAGTSESYKISKENIKELSVGDKLGKDSVSDLYKISEGVYQATLSREENGVGSAQDYFVIDNSIINQLDEELKELVVSFETKSVIENKSYEPYILKDLIEKGLMPPRDEDYVQKLDEYISIHPLKYEKLKPVDYLNFERKLKEIAEIDKEFNKTPFELGQQLVALVDESDRPKLMDWLKYEQGCDSPENMKRVFASWLKEEPEQKKDVNRKKENGYPPRGEN